MLSVYSVRYLTHAEKLHYHARMTDGDAVARQMLIESVWACAFRVSQRIGGRRFSQDELKSLASEGAILGVDHWKPARGALTTSTYWQTQKVVLYAMRERNLIRVPPHALKDRHTHTKQAHRALRIHRLNSHARAIVDRSEGFAAQIEREEEWRRVEDAIGRLPAQQQMAVENMLAGRRLAEGGARYGVCRERERQVRAEALGELRRILGVTA